MAGFIRGLALIGVMAVYSPVHHGADRPNWTEGVAGIAGSALFATSARAQDAAASRDTTPLQSLTGQALADLARELGPDMAKRLADLDPEARRALIDMTLAAAAKANSPSGEAKPKR